MKAKYLALLAALSVTSAVQAADALTMSIVMPIADVARSGFHTSKRMASKSSTMLKAT